VVNAAGDIFRLIPASVATTPFTTADAGKHAGDARKKEGSLYQGETLTINDSTDLSKVMVGPNGACAHSIRMGRSPLPSGSVPGVGDVGYQWRITIEAQGPTALLDSLYLVFYADSGWWDYKMVTDSTRKTHSIDFNSPLPGINRIRWYTATTGHIPNG
jgi:hypothetical protein